MLPFKESYWAQPGRLAAGRFPADPDVDQTRVRLEGLIAAGVDFVINLTFPDEQFADDTPCPDYSRQLRTLAQSPGRSIECVRLPIRDHDVPSNEHMRSILDTIDGAHLAGRTVYVHCLAGKGRTGTVVGCWLVRHGIAVGDAALWQLLEFVDHRPTSFGGLPQTMAQCQFVRQWSPGQ
jgi:hypothetical protein